MNSHTPHMSAPWLAVVIALLSLATTPAWAGGYFSDREASPAIAVYAVDQNGVIDTSSRKVRAGGGDERIVLQPVGSTLQISVGSDAGDIANAQAALDAAQGNVYALASNNGGIVRATDARTINGRIWLTGGRNGDTVVAFIAPRSAVLIASIAP